MTLDLSTKFLRKSIVAKVNIVRDWKRAIQSDVLLNIADYVAPELGHVPD